MVSLKEISSDIALRLFCLHPEHSSPWPYHGKRLFVGTKENMALRETDTRLPSGEGTIDSKPILDLVKKDRPIITLEPHNVAGLWRILNFLVIHPDLLVKRTQKRDTRYLIKSYSDR